MSDFKIRIDNESAGYEGSSWEEIHRGYVFLNDRCVYTCVGRTRYDVNAQLQAFINYFKDLVPQFSKVSEQNA